MAKHILNYHQLLMLRNEIKECSKNSISFALFNESKIKRLLMLNDMHFKVADGRLNDFVKKYVKHDENNNPIILDSASGFAKYEYVSEKAKKMFDSDYKKFTSKKIVIEL